MKSQNPSYKAGVISISQTRKLRQGEARNLPYVKGQQMFSVIGQMVSISVGLMVPVTLPNSAVGGGTWP